MTPYDYIVFVWHELFIFCLTNSKKGNEYVRYTKQLSNKCTSLLIV